MSFMQPQITLRARWWEIDGTSGITYVPKDDFGREDLPDVYEGDITEADTKTGYGYRLSAPGYLDQTEWGVADTVEEAARELLDAYGTDEDECPVLAYVNKIGITLAGF